MVDLCVTIFDVVFDFNLKWSDLLRTQLCCTLIRIACSDPARRCTSKFSSSPEQFIAERIASQESEWFPCTSCDLHTLSQKLAEVQIKA